MKIPNQYPEKLALFLDLVAQSGIVPNREHATIYNRSESYTTILNEVLIQNDDVLEIGGGNWRYSANYLSHLNYNSWQFFESRTHQSILSQLLFQSEPSLKQSKIKLLQEYERIDSASSNLAIVHLDYISQINEREIQQVDRLIELLPKDCNFLIVGFDPDKAKTGGYHSQTNKSSYLQVLDWIKKRTNHMHMGFDKINMCDGRQIFSLKAW